MEFRPREQSLNWEDFTGMFQYIFLFHMHRVNLSVLMAWVGLGQPGSARTTYYCYTCRIGLQIDNANIE